MCEYISSNNTHCLPLSQSCALLLISMMIHRPSARGTWYCLSLWMCVSSASSTRRKQWQVARVLAVLHTRARSSSLSTSHGVRQHARTLSPRDVYILGCVYYVPVQRSGSNVRCARCLYKPQPASVSGLVLFETSAARTRACASAFVRVCLCLFLCLFTIRASCASFAT